MSELPTGAYEKLLTDALLEAIEGSASDRHVRRRPLHEQEAPDRLTLHFSQSLRRALSAIPEHKRIQRGVEVTRLLIDALVESFDGELLRGEHPLLSADVLEAIEGFSPDGSVAQIVRPITPLLDTTLLTNAPGEPRIGMQIATEIPSADRVDVVMAFVRRSGIAPMLDVLRNHVRAGRPLRLLTTVYTGSTEAKALEILRELGADVRISYDESSTRLHAKSWLFHRDSGYSTAYVGSSNLTHSAQVSGLEWNVRLSAARNGDVLEKIAAVFESYWHGGDFIPFDPEQFSERIHSQSNGRSALLLSPLEVRLEPFQERLLELIELARLQGHHRNLLVAATGTGKTVMAAADFGQLRRRLPRDRLLFVAHRQQILEQSRATFCQVLRDPSFGEYWVDGKRPERYEHVFASIQSLSANDLEHLDPGHFDVVIVDEFHHAEAPTYRRLLERLKPRELIGLTATPERGDGESILHWFDDRIAAELRLWDAIDQHRLVPFCYYGIHDGTDLSQLPWRRGTGYEVAGLTNIYTANDLWARRVLEQLSRRVDDPAKMRALGFCVGVDHARFMARKFCEHGLPALAISGESSTTERQHALSELSAGRLNALFSVDLFNEGLDVPLVDTLLLMRPTDSATLFIQQLGRGLRRAQGKSVCTVLDFVGNAHRDFRFDRRLCALIGGTRRMIENQIEQGFPYLPAGCHMELDAITRRIVLDNLKQAIAANWPSKVEALRKLSGQQPDVSLQEFMRETGLALEDIYDGKRGWSDLRQAAGLPVAQAGPLEQALRRSLNRLLHADDTHRLEYWNRWVTMLTPPALTGRDHSDVRTARMLLAQVLSRREIANPATLDEAIALLWRHPQVLAEIGELCSELMLKVQHVQAVVPEFSGIPLRVHACYTRNEILAAFASNADSLHSTWREGVKYLSQPKVDLLAFTLNKTSSHFSPTTRYRDYAISRDLIHWESQSTTRANSPTGLRYRSHVEQGSMVLMFARLSADDRAFWFLGPATYVSHKSELPMQVTWRLRHQLPGDLYAQFCAAVA